MSNGNILCVEQLPRPLWDVRHSASLVHGYRNNMQVRILLAFVCLHLLETCTNVFRLAMAGHIWQLLCSRCYGHFRSGLGSLNTLVMLTKSKQTGKKIKSYMRQHKVFKSSLYPWYFFDFTKTDNYFIFLWLESMTPLNCETFFSLIFPKLTPNSFRVFLHCIYHIVIDV